MRRVKRILACILILLLSGCIKSKGSPTLLDNNTCTSPCWNGLIPGETSANDTFTIISQLSQVDEDSIKVDNPGNFHRGARFDLVSGERAEMIFQNDKLIFIGFYYPESFVALDVTFRQVLDELGEPDSVVVTIGPGGDCYLTVFRSLYVERGIAFSFTANPGCTIFGLKNLKPSTHIDELYYFDPSYFDMLIDNGNISRGYFTSQNMRGLMEPWKGYGNIKNLYHERDSMP
jgi:hypothetical protein